MEKKLRLFDVVNLTEEEKAIRIEGIDFLFNLLIAKHPSVTRDEAEAFYDKMQQAAIDSGASAWKFYK